MSFYGYPVLFGKKDYKITLSKACTLNTFTEEKLPMFQARALAFYLEYNTSNCSKTNSNYSHEILPLIQLKQESDKTWNLSERNLYLHPADVSNSSDDSFYNQIHMICYPKKRKSAEQTVSYLTNIQYTEVGQPCF